MRRGAVFGAVRGSSKPRDAVGYCMMDLRLHFPEQLPLPLLWSPSALR